MTADPFMAIAVRSALAALLLAGAWHKLRDRASFRQAIEDYRLLPSIAVPAAALLLPLAEAAAAVTALLGSRFGLAAIAGLLLLYAAGIGINLQRGRRHIDCGCFAFGKTGQAIGPFMVWRNILLAAFALLVAQADVGARPLLWLDWFGLAAAVASAAILYGIVDTAMPPMREMRP